jgi:LPS export ABC transporter permease LptF/LPS export ABC transporter permease LptG
MFVLRSRHLGTKRLQTIIIAEWIVRGECGIFGGVLKLFDRYILKDILPAFLIGLLVYSFLLLMNQILLLSEVLITRGVSLSVVLSLLFYLLPSVLAFTLPMSVAVGILAGLSRLSSDSEIIAFKTLGVGHKRIIRPILLFAVFGFIITSFLTLYLAPRSNYKWVQMFSTSVLSKVHLKIKPRRFNESIPNIVLYIQDIAKNDEWRNLFIYFSEPRDEPRIVFAKRGHLNFNQESQKATLELTDGVLHSYPLDEPIKYRVTTFKSFEENLPVQNIVARTSDGKHVREKDIEELNRDAKKIQADLVKFSEEEKTSRKYWIKKRDYISHWVEIHKKFALPFACLIFAILGLPLGATTRKGGRTSGFTISIGIILVYYVLITAGEQFAMDGKIPPFIGMWGPNILFSILGVFLFIRSVRESSLIAPVYRFFQRHKKKKSPARIEEAKTSGYRLPFSLRFPNLLDRYILRKYLFIFSLAFFSMLFIFVIVTFFERIDSVYEHNKPLSMFFHFIWLKMPEFILYILPIAALISTLLSLGLANKFNEITAMKACGISIYRIVLPLLFMGILISFVSYYIQENILPFSNKKAEETWYQITDVPARSYRHLDRRWVLNREGNRIYNYSYLDQEALAFNRLSVFEIDSVAWSLEKRIFSEKGYLQGHDLFLTNAWYRTFDGDRPVAYEKSDGMVLPDVEDKNFFLKDWKEPDQMSYGELKTYIGNIEEKSFETTRFKVDLQHKRSFPLTIFVITLLGIPFAFTMGKKGTLVGIGMSMGIVMIYWGGIGIFKSLGYVSYLSPFLAAWGPNLIFGLVGLYMILTLRT